MRVVDAVNAGMRADRDRDTGAMVALFWDRDRQRWNNRARSWRLDGGLHVEACRVPLRLGDRCTCNRWMWSVIVP
jgi:hypothetical protein